MTVGERIKNRRLELGYSQSDLAKLMGYKGKTGVSKMERAGDNLNTASIQKFADALHCSVSYLMGFSTENINPNDADIVATVSKMYLSLNEEHKKQILNQMEYLLFLQTKN